MDQNEGEDEGEDFLGLKKLKNATVNKKRRIVGPRFENGGAKIDLRFCVETLQTLRIPLSHSGMLAEFGRGRRGNAASHHSGVAGRRGGSYFIVAAHYETPNECPPPTPPETRLQTEGLRCVVITSCLSCIHPAQWTQTDS